MLFLCVLLTLGLVCSTESATTAAPSGNHTHHHHESPEMDSYSFTFDGVSNKLLVKSGGKCYIYSITHKEHANIHTDEGLRAVELRVLNDIDKAFYTVVDRHILATNIIHSCGAHTTSYYIVH